MSDYEITAKYNPDGQLSLFAEEIIVEGPPLVGGTPAAIALSPIEEAQAGRRLFTVCLNESIPAGGKVTVSYKINDQNTEIGFFFANAIISSDQPFLYEVYHPVTVTGGVDVLIRPLATNTVITSVNPNAKSIAGTHASITKNGTLNVGGLGPLIAHKQKDGPQTAYTVNVGAVDGQGFYVCPTTTEATGISLTNLGSGTGGFTINYIFYSCTFCL